MKKSIWLSYDLGVQGDYEGLYRWLDNEGAVECGDSFAFLKIEIPDAKSVPQFLTEEIKANVSLGKTDRVYVIWFNPTDKQMKGRFIVGKRKGSPWEGFGDVASTQDDL
jgi:hypothetical protein